MERKLLADLQHAEDRIHADRLVTDFPLFADLFKGDPGPGALRYHFAQWKKFHFTNARVWSLFQTFAYQALDAGHSRYSSDAILHRIRWHVTVETKGDAFKINNNHSAYYGRLFAKTYPNIALFETRKLASGEDEAWLDYELTEIAYLSTKEFSR